VLKTGRPKLNIEEPYESAGGIRWVKTDKVPIIDDKGLTIGLVGFAQDITERKLAEQALQDSEKRVRLKLDAILTPQGDIGTLELEDILDIRAIQAIMDDFYKLTNMSAWILDLKGNILVATGWRDICTRFHRTNPETCKNCVESDTQLSEGVAPGTFKIYKCKNNMWDLVTPIIVGDKHVGNLFLGQFLFDDEILDYELFRSQARQYGFDEADYIAALEQVPRWNSDAVNASRGFYSKFAHMISTLSYSNIALARSLTEKNNLLNELRESEEKYRNLFDNAIEAIFVAQEGKTVFLNPQTSRIIGYPAEEIREKPFIEFIHVDDREMVIDRQVRRLKGDWLPGRYSFRIIHNNGDLKWVELNTVVITWQGKPATLNFLQDITERKMAEKAKQESEAQYRLLAEHTTDFVWLMDMDLKPTYQSPSAERLTGFTQEELATLPIEKRVTPQSLKLAAEMFLREMPLATADPEYNTILTLELEIYRKDGSTLWSENKFSIIRDENGKPESILGEARDITNRKQAEEALRQSEQYKADLIEKLNQAQRVAKVGSWDWKFENNTVWWSDETYHIFGVTPKEYTAALKGHYQFIHPDDLEEYKQAFKHSLKATEPLDFDGRLIDKDGIIKYCNAKGSVILNEFGKPIRFVGTIMDITERRESEKKLEQTLAALAKTLSDTVIAISKMVEMKDPFTAGHQMRVAQLANALANKMKLTDEQATILNTAATIHDIGKIYVPSDILSKPGKLNPLEYEIIQTHVRGSYEILKEIDFAGPIAEIVFQHHERIDGSGYPRALKRDEILPEAKILIVADVVEAMSSHRPYRASMGINKALEEISVNRGRLYDEAAVDACLDLFNNDRFWFSPVESSRIV